MGFSNFLFGGSGIGENAQQFQDEAYIRSQAQGGIASVGNRQATQVQGQQAEATQLAGGPQNQTRQGQMGLASQLQGIMGGQQAGAGELAAQRQAQRQMASQQATARMSRGAGGAYAGLGAQRNMSDIGAAAAGQSQMAAMQDQQQAQGLYSNLMGQTRGQDLQFAGQNAELMQQRNMQNAQLRQQANMGNQDASLRMTGMNDAATMGYMNQLSSMNQAEMQARMEKQQADAASGGGFMGSLMSTGAQLGAASMTGGASMAAGAAKK